MWQLSGFCAREMILFRDNGAGLRIFDDVVAEIRMFFSSSCDGVVENVIFKHFIMEVRDLRFTIWRV